MSYCSEKARRAANWTKDEKAFCLELIRSSEKIFSRFRGATRGGKEKNVEWAKITDQLNASGLTSGQRSVKEVKNMFKNAKTVVTAKLDKTKATGEGAVLFAQDEEIMADLLTDRNPRQAFGIPGGVETFIFQEDGDYLIPITIEDKENMPQPQHQQPQPQPQQQQQQQHQQPHAHEQTMDQEHKETDDNNSTKQQSDMKTWRAARLSSESSKGKKSTLKRKLDFEEHLYTLEEERTRAETEAFRAKKSYYEQKMAHAMELHHLQKQILENKVKNLHAK